MSLKDSNENHLMHSWIDKRETMIGNNTCEIIGKLFQSLFHRYHVGLENST